MWALDALQGAEDAAVNNPPRIDREQTGDSHGEIVRDATFCVLQGNGENMGKSRLHWTGVPGRTDSEIREQLEGIKSEPCPWRGLKKTASKHGSWRICGAVC